MSKRVNHLIAIGAFTRHSIPMPLPNGTSLESVVEDLYEEWKGERLNCIHIPSGIRFDTLLERSRQPKGILPLIAEQPEAIDGLAYYPSSLGILQIRDDKGVILGYRFKIPPDLLATLNASSKTLDACGMRSRGGGSGYPLARGTHQSRNYCVWADYGKKYFESSDLLWDGEQGREWLRANKELFNYCSNQLRFLCPEQYVRMTGKVVKDMANGKRSADGGKMRPLCGAWHGVSLNQGQVSAGRGHQDWVDDKRLFNCVAPFGDGFGGGDLVLWQMRMRIQLEIGDGFFFYGSMVAHEVMEVTAGVRNSIDLFTHASNFQLLAKHEKMAGRVKYPVKEQKRRAGEKKEERRTVGKNAAARKAIREGKKLRQRALGMIRN